MKRNTLLTILGSVLIIVAIIFSCSTTETQGGITPVEEMSQDEYSLFVSEIKVIARLGVRPLLRSEKVSQEDVLAVASIFRGLAEKSVLENVEVLFQDLIPNQELADALLLVSLELKRRGAFGVLDEGGKIILTERTKGLLVEVAEALETL